MLPATDAAGAGRRPPTDEERERARALRDRREREDLAAAARLARETLLRRAGVAGCADEAKGLRMWRDVAGGCPGFLLYGPPGTGKTSAAMCVLSSRIEQKGHWELSRVRTRCAHRF